MVSKPNTIIHSLKLTILKTISFHTEFILFSIDQVNGGGEGEKQDIQLQRSTCDLILVLSKDIKYESLEEQTN